MTLAARWFDEYPMLVGIGFALIVMVLLGVVFGTLMRRAGLSLRPLVWFFVLMALVGGPQALMHVLDVVAFERQKSSRSRTGTHDADAELRPVPWSAVFGAGADPALVTDPRVPLGAVLAGATAARLSFDVAGGSALAARFPSPGEARQAMRAYTAFFRLADVTGRASAGLTGRRYGNSGEWNHVVVAGDELYAWTGSGRDLVIARREQALGPVGESRDTPFPISGGARALRAHEARLVTGRLGWQVMVPFAALNLALVVLWVLRGGAWAARVTSPRAGSTVPVRVDALRSRLLAVCRDNDLLEATAGDDGTVTLDWRHRDLRWIDLARAHRVTRTQRLVMHLDEADHTVRVCEYWGAFDASAGADGLRLQWHRASGIRFFDREHHRVLGAQFDARGRPTGALSAVLAVDAQAMKRPAMAAVTGAGWRWQPVLWRAPTALRWLAG